MKTRLRQVLLNLLGNGVKFTNEGAVTLCIEAGEETAVSPQNQSFTFKIEDTGIGLTQNDIDRIFKPYEQAGSKTSRHKGTGLGLSICQQLVQLMGSTLHVSSTPGKGSTFSFEVTFPISKQPIAHTSQKESIPTGYHGPPRSVLIVDDIASNRLVLKAMLRPLGIKTFEAKNGYHALEISETVQPDLILMDRWMPEMDGLTAITNLRDKDNFQDTPIIAVSASIGPEDKAQFEEAGANDFLPKPIAMPALIKMLQKHLRVEWQYQTNNTPKET